MIFRFAADVASVSGTYSSINTTPVIASYESNFTIVWKNGTGGLYARSGSVTTNGITQSTAVPLTGTTSNSINPTIYSSKTCCTWVKKTCLGRNRSK